MGGVLSRLCRRHQADNRCEQPAEVAAPTPSTSRAPDESAAAAVARPNGRFASLRRSLRRWEPRARHEQHARRRQASLQHEPAPSLLAAGVAIEWRQATSGGDKNCNVTADGLPSGRSRWAASSEELTQEFLMQIIRCFPFPSPRPSPKSSPQSPRRRVFGRRNNDERDGDALPRLSKEEVSAASVASAMNTVRQIVVNSVDTMAITALPLECWLKERLKHWVQLSGHEGTIVPASDHTLWKKRAGTDCSESTAYRNLMNDIVSPFCPQFFKEVDYKGETFIEIEDLTSHFKQPTIMDIKMGTRTFLESEVMNPVGRKDLYQKMVKLDGNEPTADEHAEQAVTKLRYMQFRERESSTAALGFRIEAIKVADERIQKHFQKVKTRDQVMAALRIFLGERAAAVRECVVQRLRVMRAKVEQSAFFRTHEVIGSSLLFMHDECYSSVWMIDFAKALPTADGRALDHRTAWQLGNHEDGYLTGLDNLIQLLEDSQHKEVSVLDAA